MLPLLFVLLSHISVVTGTASYYSNVECKGCTATGEKFVDGKLTLAMRDGELNSNVLVLSDTSARICKLNDRGPWNKKRVADLSKKAMKELGGNGLLEVTIIRWTW